MEPLISENICKDLITKEDLVEIDGSTLEGGGQILRITLTLSILFSKQVKLINIRGKRTNPGLQKQHLAVTSALSQMTGSELIGAKLSSKEITLKPGKFPIAITSFKCDASGAGSIGLMIQQILPCALFFSSKTTIEMAGGTIGSFSPPTFFIIDVLCPLLSAKMGITFEIETKKHGMYPRGGGFVNFLCQPVSSINPITITERGKLRKVLYRVCSTNNFAKISLKDFKTVEKEILKSLKSKYKSQCDEIIDTEDGDHCFTYETEFVELPKFKKTYTIFFQTVLIYEHTIISAEKLFSEKKEANANDLKSMTDEFLSKIEQILDEDCICLDEYTVDHLIIFMALAKGTSKIQIGNISMHTLTAIEIIKRFVPEIKISITSNEENKNCNIIEIEGIGYSQDLKDNI